MEKVVSSEGHEADRDHGTVTGTHTKTPRTEPLCGSRKFFDNRFVYSVISQRARGLSVGVNLNPDQFCTFDCIYCEISRNGFHRQPEVDLKQLATELGSMLALAKEDKVHELPGYHTVPRDLLKLKEVALSGNGEPTFCENFHEVVQVVVHLRAQGEFPFFKIVLITNSTGLHLPQVQLGLQLFTAEDEIWAKLDAGTQAHLERINRPKTCPEQCPDLSLQRILENILKLGRQRPIVIQSLFALLDGEEPPAEEIEQYVLRLKELKGAGAQISLVQVYSAHRPTIRPGCSHLPLRSLSRIAQRVREVTGLKAEVF
jgi:wyosine [tRNA(Phe)-imidazoG37] synthetase (radical SAM superfamily)